jgi:hypothetical protein
MVFDAGVKAMNNQPGVKLAKAMNVAAKNPNLTQPAAVGAIALASASGLSGAGAGSNVMSMVNKANNVNNMMNKANNIKNIMRGGKRIKSRRRRR